MLARPEGAGPGTKGLSLFFVPKFAFDPRPGTGQGTRNGVFVTNVEHKMGIKASATCEVTFGGQHGVPARAGSSARSTRASRRCSRSSSMPA